MTKLQTKDLSEMSNDRRLSVAERLKSIREKLESFNPGGGGSGALADRVLVINTQEDNIEGKQYKTFAEAFAYIASLETPPSLYDRWAIRFSGTIYEDIKVPAFIHIIGENRETSVLGGKLDFVGGNETYKDKVVSNCFIGEINLTQGDIENTPVEKVLDFNETFSVSKAFFSFTSTPTTGQYSLRLNGVETDLLPYNATASEIQTAFVNAGFPHITVDYLGNLDYNINLWGVKATSNTFTVGTDITDGIIKEVIKDGSNAVFNLLFSKTPIAGSFYFSIMYNGTMYYSEEILAGFDENALSLILNSLLTSIEVAEGLASGSLGDTLVFFDGVTYTITFRDYPALTVDEPELTIPDSEEYPYTLEAVEAAPKFFTITNCIINSVVNNSSGDLASFYNSIFFNDTTISNFENIICYNCQVESMAVEAGVNALFFNSKIESIKNNGELMTADCTIDSIENNGTMNNYGAYLNINGIESQDTVSAIEELLGKIGTQGSKETIFIDDFIKEQDSRWTPMQSEGTTSYIEGANGWAKDTTNAYSTLSHQIDHEIIYKAQKPEIEMIIMLDYPIYIELQVGFWDDSGNVIAFSYSAPSNELNTFKLTVKLPGAETGVVSNIQPEAFVAYKLSTKWNGDDLEFYVNDVLQGTIEGTKIPSNGLKIRRNIIARDNVPVYMAMDYIKVKQDREV